MVMIIKEEYKRGVELACEQAFKLLKNSIEEWDEPNEIDQYYYRQNISMMFYNLVFKYGSNSTGYCEMGAEKSGTDDHWLSPRMGCYALMNQRRDLLDNYDKFREYFMLLRTTIKIIKSKNDTDEIKFVNDIKTGIVVKNLTIDKYDLIISKWSYVRGLGKNRRLKHLDEELGFPLKELVPDFFIAEERKYYTPRGKLDEFI